MNPAIDLFRGDLGWAAGILVIAGAVTVAESAWSWLADRFEMTGLSLPQRRWDRPGARVRLPDGREGLICDLVDDDAAGNIAKVNACGDDECSQPEWVLTSLLSPLAQSHPKEA